MYVEVVSGLGEALVGNWPGAALSFTAAKPPLAAAVAAARGSEGCPQVTNLQAELDSMRDNLQSASLCCCTCPHFNSHLLSCVLDDFAGLVSAQR